MDRCFDTHPMDLLSLPLFFSFSCQARMEKAPAWVGKPQGRPYRMDEQTHKLGRIYIFRYMTQRSHGWRRSPPNIAGEQMKINLAREPATAKCPGLRMDRLLLPPGCSSHMNTLYEVGDTLTALDCSALLNTLILIYCCSFFPFCRDQVPLGYQG